jgi:preprotein translocase subunit SecD
MTNSYFVVVIIIVSVFLFAFVYPQGVSKYIELPSFMDRQFSLGLDLLGGAHLLYEADLGDIPAIGRQDAMDGIRDVIERRVNLFGVSEPLVQVSGENRLIVELAGINDVNEAINLIGETPFLEFKEQREGLEELLESGEIPEGDPFVSTELNGKHVKQAQLVFDPQTGIPQVNLELNEEGAKLFAEITKKNLGKIVAIYLDGEPISVPVVQAEITSGSAVISGGFSPDEARLLANRLNAGALPVPITLVSQQTIGASLGEESITKSLKAGVYGLLLVALFMILFYRLPGLVSVVALAIYILIVLSIYKLLPVTLTLAGISGFILSLGIAVDANILIFARMREELRSGRTVKQSLREGFARAWLSIRDSHVTTLIGAGVLYIFTTSIVKGFALTLAIGILVSFFTAIFITKSLLRLFTNTSFDNRKRLFH